MSGDLSTVGLSARYGSREVLTDITATILGGSLCTLLGPNGAGKSTLLKTLAGIVHPTAGNISLNGEALMRLSLIERARRIAYVPQLHSSALPMTVLESMHAARYPWRRGASAVAADEARRIDAALGKLRLRDKAGAKVATLSGGEWRRLMIAQGLVQLGDQQGILLLDEPTAFLDPPARLEVLLILRGLSDAGLTVISVLHEVHLAKSWSDTVLLLRDGRLIESGPPAEVLTVDALCELYGCRPQELLLAEITQ
jgi:iron complex transport system ATP-binding protein